VRALLLLLLMATSFATARASPGLVADAFDGCPPGQEKSAQTKELCCWPGQTSSDGKKCAGLPSRCPRGFTFDRAANDCRLAACTTGQVRAQNGVDCCWQGQAWSWERARCVGAPVCPPGATRVGEGCFASCPATFKAKPWSGPVPSDMVAIPGACVERIELDAKRANAVSLSPFLIDRHEVTAGAYDACVKAGRCRPATDLLLFSAPSEHPFCNSGVARRAEHPMNCVSWRDAQAYCTAQGKRLPSEAEWDHAARGPDRREYPWGTRLPTVKDACWQPGRAEPKSKAKDRGTCAVGQHPSDRSPFGLVDVAGNVTEWTVDLDWAHDSNDVLDPRGRPESPLSVVRARGGSWYDWYSDGLLLSRASTPSYLASEDRGFRCARGLPTSPFEAATAAGPIPRAPTPTPDWGGQACPDGQKRSADTAGHCCWRGQVFARGRCVGVPTGCGREGLDLDAEHERCSLICPAGQTSVDDGRSCCWPGQAWSASAQQCTGSARCPSGMTSSRAGTSCEPDCRAVPYTGAAPPGMVAMAGGCLHRERYEVEGWVSRAASTHAVRPFAIDRTEVTVADYARCVAQGRCTLALDQGDCNAGLPGREDQPINCVNWFQSRDYCEFAGKRLPSSVEWEFAARGPESRKYPWGDEAPGARACWSGVGARRLELPGAKTCVVGSHPGDATPLGVLDLAGNVQEWLSDDIPTSSNDKDSPPPGDRLRARAGGAWDDAEARFVEATFPKQNWVQNAGSRSGVRCAKDAPSP
jgi:formylglycine-generating enzyme required for sulfatase activity